MSTITLPNIRVFSDLTVKVRLKDGGVAIDWSTLSNLRAWIYSDAQSSFAGRCDVTVDGEDATLLVCRYAATRMQYLGVNRIVVSARYMGAAKTYDKPVLNFVRWTEDQAGEQITIEDPEVTVEIDVEDISSSILQEAVDAAFSAAVRADEAAAAAEHMVDIHQGPPGPAGKAPYVDATTGNWFVWDDQTEQYVDSGNPAQGPAGNGIASWSVVESQEDGGSNVVTVVFTNGESESFTVKNGNTGATPNLVMGIVTTGAPGSQAGAQITGTPANPILHLTIPQGEPGVAAVRYVQVDTLPSASSHTLDALYLVPTNTTDVYDVYYTTRDGQTYSWVKLCTTSVQLSDYATKAEVTQLEAKMNTLALTRYYGIFASAALLPADASEKGYAYVGATAPLSIYEVAYNNETEQWEWTNTGVTISSVQGEPGTDGVGFSTIGTPVVVDGTVIITLSNGDTVTLDLNHDHLAYPKYHLCADEAEYTAITTKDSATLYLIPES